MPNWLFHAITLILTLWTLIDLVGWWGIMRVNKARRRRNMSTLSVKISGYYVTVFTLFAWILWLCYIFLG